MAGDRLRVLMLTPDQGFLDRRIAQEAASIARLGHTVDIYAVYGALPTLPGELGPGVRMLPEPGAAGELGGDAYRFGRRIKRSLKRVSPALYRFADGLQSIFMDRAVVIANASERDILALGRYDAVFAHDIPVLPLGARLRTAWGAALVCDLHEVYPEQDEVVNSRWTRAYWRRIERRYLPTADRILCVNPAVKDYVQRAYGLGDDIEVVYNSVPFAPAWAHGAEIHQLFGIDPSRKVLVYAGSLRANANLEQLVEGFALANIPGWALALLGSGDLEDRLLELVDANSAGDRIFLGQRVGQPDLIRVLSSADVGVVPYTAIGFNHEIATPNKLFEYIQARLPIASSRLPQIERILTKYCNGGFVDLASAKLFARDIRRFIANEMPAITAATLEEAARNVCWERDEQAVRRAFRAVTDTRGSVRGAARVS